jgi:hypothetical protein
MVALGCWWHYEVHGTVHYLLIQLPVLFLNTARPETPPYPILSQSVTTTILPSPYYYEGVSCFFCLWFTSRPLIARCGP